MPFDPSNLPPELVKALAAMTAQQDQFVGGLHQQTTDATTAEGQSWDAVLKQAQQPPAQLDPHQEFIGRLMGNLSQAIAPSMGGQAQAEQVLAERKHVLQQQQMQRLQLLSQHHDELAKRAEQAGDTETAAKQSALAFRHGEKLRAMSTVFSENMANTRAHEGNVAQIQSAEIAARAHILAAGAGGGLLTKFDPGSQGIIQASMDAVTTADNTAQNLRSAGKNAFDKNRAKEATLDAEFARRAHDRLLNRTVAAPDGGFRLRPLTPQEQYAEETFSELFHSGVRTFKDARKKILDKTGQDANGEAHLALLAPFYGTSYTPTDPKAKQVVAAADSGTSLPPALLARASQLRADLRSPIGMVRNQARSQYAEVVAALRAHGYKLAPITSDAPMIEEVNVSAQRKR